LCLSNRAGLEEQPRTNLHGTLDATRPIHCSACGHVFRASYAKLPLRSGSCASIECLDVIEFVRDDEEAVAELARVLRPGGTLLVRVPNRGPLAGLDSFNLYRYLVDISRRGRQPPETNEVGWRRHYSLTDLATLLGPRFSIRRAATHRLAIAEIVNLLALVAFRGLTRSDARYRRAQSLVRTIERLEDKIRLGTAGSVLLVEATRLPDATECTSQADADAGKRPRPSSKAA
jgi:SAM-dependent methyltransferase